VPAGYSARLEIGSHGSWNLVGLTVSEPAGGMLRVNSCLWEVHAALPGSLEPLSKLRKVGGRAGKMESIWWVGYGTLSVAAIVQALLLVLQTWEHRRYARNCMRELAKHRPTGRVAVFAPCKGLDVDLEGNLRALMAQDYPEFEVSFVVESVDDPACPVIRCVMADYAQVPARLVVAGHAVESGQKVHNLRVATAQLASDVKYLAFLDSDARPRPEWLRMLIARCPLLRRLRS